MVKSDRCFYFASFSSDLRVLNATLLQDGVHHIEVDGRHTDVHINVNGHQLSAVGAPEVDLEMAPKTNT